MSEPIVITGIVDPATEDSGAALIAEIDSTDEHFFVRLQSYDERVWKLAGLKSGRTTSAEAGKTGHTLMNQLRGKLVRVTVAVIDDPPRTKRCTYKT